MEREGIPLSAAIGRGEEPGEGNPTDPGQARVQASTHEQGGGASVGPKRGRPSPYALEDTI